MRITPPARTIRLVCLTLALLWSGTLCCPATLVAQTEVASPPDSQALQEALLDGLAAGRDVSAVLSALRHHPTPPVPAPLPPRPTAAADLQAQLVALRQALT